MHITEKILSEIELSLCHKYHTTIQFSDWDLFKMSPINKNGSRNNKMFNERQEKAVKIIREILKHHGKVNIIEYLAILASIEPNIQDIQPRVRDHVVHAINTFLLGVYILEKVSFPGLISDGVDYPFMWKLTGPTHDLGYPIEIARNINKIYINKINEFLSTRNSPSPQIMENVYPYNLNKLCNGVDANHLIQDKLTEWALGINIDHYYAWLNSNNKTDHGVISALTQLKLIDTLYQENNPNRINVDIIIDGLNYNQSNFTFDIVTASTALFIHNIDLEYEGFSNKINFELAPLAFLLFLCDTFQEWDRYSKKRKLYCGKYFDIQCSTNLINLYVPDELEDIIFSSLDKRLTGMKIRINDKKEVS